MTKSSNKLSELLDDAFKILFIDNLGVNHAEPVFIKVLEILQNDSTAKAWFLEQATKKIIFGGGVILAGTTSKPVDFIDYDLVCFVAHATRWPEFADASRIRKQSKTYIEKLPGSRDYADEIDAALSDDWEDREFYQSFGGE